MKYTEDLVPRIFFDALSPKLKLLFEEVLEEGMILTMVGGATRDFLLNGRVPKDIDLEVRMEVHLEEEEWKKTLFVLGQKLKSNYSVEFLPFGILRIPVSDTIVEISSPRIEQYSDEGPWGHSDFSAKLSPTFCHEDSFRRRDFTINAIGFEFSDLIKLRIQDPYRGIDDLKAGILRPCSEDFFKDPVRFLRLIRFSKKFNYRLAPSLELNLTEFNLSKLKPFHFGNEAFKSGFFEFLNDFFLIVDNKNIELSSDLVLFKALLDDSIKMFSCHSFQEAFIGKVFNGKDNSASLELKKLSEKLGLKNNFLDQLYEFKKILIRVHQYHVSQFKSGLKNLVQNADLKTILTDDRLLLLERFSFYEKRLASYRALFDQYFPEDFKICLKELGHLCEGELLGEDLFLKLSEDLQIVKEQKALLRLYTHLKQAIIT